MHCDYGGQCGGCPLYHTDYAQQQTEKIDHLKNLWFSHDLGKLSEIQFIKVAEEGLRDRADLTWHIDSGKARLGLYDLDRSEILDLKNCSLMSKQLGSWYQKIRNIKFPIQLGSLRLRVGPSGQKGVWLDFSNINVKELFDEQDSLKSLLELGVVEIGQRRKRLVFEEGKPKLKEPQSEYWFETYIYSELKPVPLKCSIADFTQPSMQANKVLVKTVLDCFDSNELGVVYEFGSGIGNFTLPLASQAKKVHVFERDKYSLVNLEENLKLSQLMDKVEIHKGDFQRIKAKMAPDFSKADTVFVDPPRSGLKEFLDSMSGSESLPKNFVYVSCFAESFCEDSRKLIQMNYKLNKMSVVDQFPHSHHYEIVAHFVQV